MSCFICSICTLWILWGYHNDQITKKLLQQLFKLESLKISSLFWYIPKGVIGYSIWELNQCTKCSLYKQSHQAKLVTCLLMWSKFHIIWEKIVIKPTSKLVVDSYFFFWDFTCSLMDIYLTKVSRIITTLSWFPELLTIVLLLTSTISVSLGIITVPMNLIMQQFLELIYFWGKMIKCLFAASTKWKVIYSYFLCICGEKGIWLHYWYILGIKDYFLFFLKIVFFELQVQLELPPDWTENNQLFCLKHGFVLNAGQMWFIWR